MTTTEVLALFGTICDETTRRLAATTDWGGSGRRDGQYAVDLDLDAACLDALHGAGLAVLSEESGLTAPDRSTARGRDGGGADIDPTIGDVVVVDPLDGSTNAALGLPWCATALCLVRDGVPTVATVANLRTGDRSTAVAGEGARLNGRALRRLDRPPSAADDGAGPSLADAVVAVNARPPGDFRPRQYRALGATALDLCSIAHPTGLDGYVDFDVDRIAVWDYLAATLVVTESGGVVTDALGRDLVVLDHAARRRPVAARSPALLDQLLAAI